MPKSIAFKGEWGPDEFCPEGSYVTSYQLYIADICPRRCKLDDDVALMGIRLFCVDYNNPQSSPIEIASSVMSPCEKTRGSVHGCLFSHAPEGHYCMEIKISRQNSYHGL
eukprot:TRINITY_DN24348_c0_g1_i1.p2 TRINITY_DN24348_c0_g1~~TRINITY_DN24348_c0_g1_i1.p2  ORF type:complete len:110 (+),score=14.22 TRINITY_DN24348_c0_g1_i1:517-846(+)